MADSFILYLVKKLMHSVIGSMIAVDNSETHPWRAVRSSTSGAFVGCR
jgi:hypothetical protein